MDHRLVGRSPVADTQYGTAQRAGDNHDRAARSRRRSRRDRGVTAAKLVRAGWDVVALDAHREHVARLREPGLEVDELGTGYRVPIEAYSSAEDLPGRFAYALVTLKAPHLEPALGPLVSGDRVETYVSLGNGLVQDRAAELVGADRMLVGTVEWGATNHGPGKVSQTTKGRFVVGEPDGPPRDRTHRLVEILSKATPTELSSTMRGQIWSKLLVNSTFSGLGVVTGLRYGDVVADPLGTRVALALWTEGVRVARALGITLEPVRGIDPHALVVDDPNDFAGAEPALAAFIEQTAATKASMLQDLERGITTEVDVINGGVVAHGAPAGVPTPLNATVVDLVHRYERGERRPDPTALGELDRHIG